MKFVPLYRNSSSCHAHPPPVNSYIQLEKLGEGTVSIHSVDILPFLSPATSRGSSSVDN